MKQLPTIFLLLLLSLSACISTSPDCRKTGGAPAVLATLYFGRTEADGTRVGKPEWTRFLAEEVTPRFPDGLTVLDGQGQWKDRATGRIGQEQSTVVVISMTGTQTDFQHLREIRDAYRRRFHQQSVGLTFTPACADFGQ